MTLDSLLKLARKEVAYGSCSCAEDRCVYHIANELARGVLELLGEAPALPCGRTVESGRDDNGDFVRIDGEVLPIEEAHAIAIAVLRACANGGPNV